ncbi:MAG: twitching motility protein PilT [Caldithrix sp.]|nr:twitching motility protein PilT [Caldithrix sp.]
MGELTVISLRFYAELNDFLPPSRRQTTYTLQLKGQPTVKDVIESQGAPHPEIDLILVNNQSVAFDYRVQDGDRIAVYPEFELLDITSLSRLNSRPLRVPRFILDVNLGKLARKLRLCGFDCLYGNDYRDKQIIRMAARDKRIILTRDTGLLKNKQVTRGYWVRSTNPWDQMEQVLNKFSLHDRIKPFNRCMDCNGMIVSVAKDEIEDQLLAQTRKHFNAFYCCTSCHKIFWRGSHYQRMTDYLNRLMQSYRENLRHPSANYTAHP